MVLNRFSQRQFQQQCRLPAAVFFGCRIVKKTQRFQQVPPVKPFRLIGEARQHVPRGIHLAGIPGSN